jgi:uncharacterized protein YndB with AHSA1/START domain
MLKGEVMSSMQEVRSFKVVQEMVIEGKPEKVFDALINDVSAWWGSPMYCTDNPSDFVFESKPGGAFYEITPDGDFAVWGRVTRYKRTISSSMKAPWEWQMRFMGACASKSSQRGRAVS